MKKNRVLIMDDSPTMAKMLNRTLSELTLNIDISTKPTDGIVKAVQNTYNIIFLDLEMPDINGIQFLKKMQQAGRNTPVIILTGKNDDRLVVGIMSQFSNVKKYLTKPYTKESVVDAVEAILNT